MTETPDQPALNDWSIRCECGYDRRRLELTAPCPECGEVPRSAPIHADIVVDGRRVVDRSVRRRLRYVVIVITVFATLVLSSGCVNGLVGPVTAVGIATLLAFASAIFLAFVIFDPTVAWVVEDDGIASYVSARREAHVPVTSIARVTFRADAPAQRHLTIELLTRDGATWRLMTADLADPSRVLAIDRLRRFLLQRGVEVCVS